MDLINNSLFDIVFVTSCVITTTIFLLFIDETVKIIVSLKQENDKLKVEMDLIKDKLKQFDYNQFEQLVKEANKLKDETSSMNNFVKEEIDELYSSIKFCNTELFYLKDSTIRSSQTFQN